MRIGSNEAWDSPARDTLKVRAGSTVLQTVSNADASSFYQLKTVDLSAFAGQPVVLSFSSAENSSLATSFLLDDLSVTSQPTVSGAPSAVWATPGNTGFTGSGTKIGNGWLSLQVMFSPRDFTGDGRSDVMGVNRATGALTLYTGNGKGGWLRSGIKVGQGWGGMSAMFSPADFTGDRRSDVLGTTLSRDLYLYRGNGTGGWTGSRQKVAGGMS